MKIHILIIIYICTGVALLGQTNESGTNTPSTNTTAMTSETGTNTTKVQTSADSDDSDDAPVIRMQVVATKTPKRISDTAADVTVITEEDLSASGAESVGEVLRANGIVVTENKSSRTVGDLIYVQGLDPTKLLILIDGQRVRPGAMGSITALSRVSLSSIKRIEIVKGPNSYLWGSDAMAGVIYIETKKGDAAKGFHGNVGGSYKNNFYLDADNHLVRPYAELSYAVPSASFTLGGSFEYGNMWLSPYTLKTIPGYPEEYKVRNERDAYRNFDIHAGSKFHFADIHALNLSGSYQQERSPLQEGSIEKNEFRKIMGNIAYQLYPNASLDISVRSGINYDAAKRVAHSQYLDDYYLFHNDEIMAVYYLNDTVAFKGGYAFELEHFNEKHNRKTYNQQNHALFFGGDIKVREPVDLDVTAGTRYQMNMRGATGFSENTILNSLSPQLGVVFKPVTILALKGNIGHSFKAPDLRTAFRDYFDHSWFFLGPNPNLKPESSWGYSAAVEFLPFKQLSFNAGIYRNDLKNLIAHDETGDYYKTLPLMTPVNIGRAYTWGVTAGAHLLLDVPQFGTLRYDLHFETMTAREVLPKNEQYVSVDGEPFNPRLANRPAFTVSGALGWHKKEWGTSAKLSGYYFDKGYEYEDVGDGVYEEIRTKAKSTLDIRIAQKILSGNPFVQSTVFFDLKNALNTRYDYDDDGDTDMPERRFVTGFDISF